MNVDVLPEGMSFSPVDSDSNLYNSGYNRGERDFETEALNLPSRYSKSRTTQLTKSTLNLTTRNHTPTIATKSYAFEGSFDHNAVMCKYAIFWTNKKDNNKLYKINIELPHLETVTEAIRDVIPYFNQKLAEEGSRFVLSTDSNFYEFCKAKKNGLPKKDYPAFDANQVLSQTSIQNITLVETDTNAICQKGGEVVNEHDSIGKVNQSTATMVSTTMPVYRGAENCQTIIEEDYVEETRCFCFKRIVKKSNKESLNEKLLE